jgi:DNA repair protein RadC
MIRFKSKLPKLELKYIPTNIDRVKITSSRNAYDYMLCLFNADTLEYSEEMVVLFLNKANNTIGYMVMEGSTSNVLICKQKLFTEALLCGAHAIILAHNHPSGRLIPSDADKKVTSEITIAGNALGITLLDHLIITNYSYLSFEDDGIIKTT